MSTVGGDPDALTALAAVGAAHERRLRRAAGRVDSTARRYRHAVAGGSRVAPWDATGGLRQLGAQLSALDRWAAGVGQALRLADGLRRSAALQLLHRRGPALDGDDLLATLLRAGADPDPGLLAELDIGRLTELGADAQLPASVRDACNRAALRAHLTRLRRRIETAEEAEASGGLAAWAESALDGLTPGWLDDALDLTPDAPGRALRRLRAQAEQIAAVLACDDVTVLAFRADAGGPDGDPLLRVAFGDVEAATHLGVLVPGTASGLRTAATVLDSAEGLHAVAAHEAGPGQRPAVVAELHDAPDTLAHAAVPSYAAVAAPALAQLVSELARPGRRVTLVGHSHGGYVAGRAALTTDEDAVVGLGAPSLGAEHADELGGEVWVAAAAGDPITFVDEVRQLLAPLLDGRLPTDGVLGPDPSEPAFGARRLPTRAQPAPDGRPELAAHPDRGHVAYPEPGSHALHGAAMVLLGRDPQRR